MTESLEQQLENAYNQLEISTEQRQSLNTYLTLIRNRDEATWEHSVRVGLKGIEVANFTNIVSLKALFYAGLLHDVGKALTDPKSLKKTQGFDENDMAELRKHPVDGYRILKDVHEFSARILLFHHYFQDNGYPEEIPETEVEFSKGSETNILFYARMLSLIDFYDAMMHRKNDKQTPGRASTITREQGKEIILKSNPDQEYFINQLYDAGIF